MAICVKNIDKLTNFTFGNTKIEAPSRIVKAPASKAARGGADFLFIVQNVTDGTADTAISKLSKLKWMYVYRCVQKCKCLKVR